MYVDDTDYTTYAATYGVTLPVTAGERLIQLTKASEYIDAQEPYLKGSRTERDQDYAYPRTGLVINGFEYEDDEIPAVVEKIQLELALEVNSGIDLFAVSNNLPIIKERVEGAVEVGYATPTMVQDKGRQSKAMTLMKQLLKGGSMSVPIIRV